MTHQQTDPHDLWMASVQETVAGYHCMINAAVEQLSDKQLFQRPRTGFNSVAVLLRHLGGNLHSRWTHFLTEDGEKPDRDRDTEFKDWNGDRQSLIEYFESGWQCLTDSLELLSADDLQETVMIRGEEHTVPQAIERSITHIAYHAGQLVMIARWIHGDDEGWQWLTIGPDKSAEHNATTWGTPAARSIQGDTD